MLRTYTGVALKAIGEGGESLRFSRKKYAFAMRLRRKSMLRQREAESSARRQKFVTTPLQSAKLDVRNSVKWAISGPFFRLVSNELNQSPFVCACTIADENSFDV
jgi:hypothetical protein